MSPNETPQSTLDFTGETKVVPRDDRRQVLSFSGGGYRGLFSARLIEHKEDAIGAPHRIRSRFKLIAGTSIGAILAAAVAAETPRRRSVKRWNRRDQKYLPTVAYVQNSNSFLESTVYA